MRHQLSVTLASLLIASVAIGLDHSGHRRAESQTSTVSSQSLFSTIQSNTYLCHRGSGRIENKLVMLEAANA